MSTKLPEPVVRAAVERHFDGDAALYAAFAAACAQQFAQDCRIGQASADAADLVKLQHLAHNLKSALLILGHVELSEAAGRLEARAAAGQLQAARDEWRCLRLGMTPLLS